ncbi:hypothetical protein RN001_005029 [Aquatica leii]|uniref:Nuclease HARBI1 n=1 Tax=Aquatica leii TaxID=1421715 RepID=A0AAN7P628_9COLE|nr:hypothetical protein RN001_005029 [Aquatica leii]
MDSDRDGEIFDDNLDILEIIDLGFPRLTYTRSDQFHELDDGSFRKRFRLSKATTLHLLTLIKNQLEYPGNMNNSVSPMNQLLTALRFYASAGHLTAIADYMGMHTSTASRIVKKVTEAIAGLYDTAMAVIVATAVLHNIALGMNEELPPCPDDLERENLENLIENG